MSGVKRQNHEILSKPVAPDDRRTKRKKSGKAQASNKQRSEGNAEEVLFEDINHLLQKSQDGDVGVVPATPEIFSQIDLSISMLSSTGDGLALSDDGKRVFVVPFSVPGDKVVAKVVRNYEAYSTTDLVEVKEPSKDRDDQLVFCEYFGRCSGCQFQMLPYSYQLEHKRKVIEKAMRNFSQLDPSAIPPIADIMPSPLSRGYRTKLTPHFNGPRRGGFKKGDPVPDIGFQVKGRNFVLDIEDCPIGTDAVREGMKKQREYVKENLHTYKRGATLLLRESTERIDLPEKVPGQPIQYKETKTCVTDSKSLSTEWIGPFKFASPAGAFFQNNNSILVNVSCSTNRPFGPYPKECLDEIVDFEIYVHLNSLPISYASALKSQTLPLRAIQQPTLILLTRTAVLGFSAYVVATTSKLHLGLIFLRSPSNQLK
ncbi:hypothetical protein ABW19_dt0209860 [Dactylella cylindrospora]|nr:hypothetical protein ABW19_dt0209860 [Dactylella cylindrospora]